MIEILEMTVFGSSKRISFIFLKVGLRDLAGGGGGGVLDKKKPEVSKVSTFMQSVSTYYMRTTHDLKTFGLIQ